MKVRYIAIYRLYGANELPDEVKNADLLAVKSPSIRTILTSDPGPILEHIDKSAALGMLLFKGAFAPEKAGTLQERLAEIEGLRASRAEQPGIGIFLVFDGETEIPIPEFEMRRDTDDFAICMDAVDKSEIRETFHPHVQCVIAALSMTLPENADRTVERIGEVVYLIDPDNGKPIYTFTLKAGIGRLSIGSPLTSSIIAETAALAAKLVVRNTIPRPTNLLITSFERKTDALQAFIAAWAALEIFVNTTFKSTYKQRWFTIMEAGAPASTKPVVDYFKEVIGDKFGLKNKFLIIASILNPAAATDDTAEFARLKEVRGGFFHNLDIPPSLPTDAIQKLLLKYMKLHLQ